MRGKGRSRIDLERDELREWRFDENGVIRARDEIAAAMAEDDVSIAVIQDLLQYSSEIATREAITRGKRYDHHLLMAKVRRRRERTRKYKKPPKIQPWNDEAVSLLRRYYPDKTLSLHDLARVLSEVAAGPITREAIIGKAYRLGIKRGFVQGGPRKQSQEAL